MSFYFNIKSADNLTYYELQSKLEIPDTQFHQRPLNLQDPIIGTKIFIPGKSTRGITISKNDESYSIGINVIASEEDFHLALNVTTTIAKSLNGEIFPEDSEGSISLEKMTKKYDETWVNMMKTLGTNIFLERVGKGKSTLSIGCCYMKYMIGPNIHKILDNSNELTYYQSMVKHIQKTQFFDVTKYQIPNVIVSTSQDGSNRKSYVVFYPHGSQFLSHADYIVFPVNRKKYEIPYEQINLIIDSRFNKIDETQYTIEPLTEKDYSELINKLEIELGKIPEETIRIQYKGFTKHELDDEFNRLSAIPNARTKIFVLQRMSILIAEFEKRNIQMPNSPSTEQNKPRSGSLRKMSKQESIKNSKSTVSKKPWWKIW